EAAGPAPGHRAAVALPRGREAAVDLRREPARLRGRRRPHPRHLQPDRRAYRPAQLRRAEPAQHPDPPRGGSTLPPRLRARPGPPTEEAALILVAYFEAFPRVKDYMDRVVAEARDRGYTETLFGRRRLIPELSSSNYRLRQAGERQAMNAGIQGLAADIFKVALVRLDRALDDGGHRSRIILQVHDEVL